MKILYVSQYFPPEMGAPAARVYELSRNWVEAGHHVTVLTGFPNHPTGIVPEDYRRQMRRLTTRERVDGIEVVRTWLYPAPNRRPMERMLNYSSFCISACLRGLFLDRPDMVIATSPQLLVGLSGWWIGRLKRCPIVFEVRDLWPESLLASGIGREDSVLIRSLEQLTSFLYRQCEQIVVVTDAFKENLMVQRRLPEEKIDVIENGVETELFSPEKDGTVLRTSYGLDGRFVVSYIGTIGYAHGLDIVLQAARRLNEVLPEALFVFIGEGAEKEKLEGMVREERLGNIRFLPQQPRESIPFFINASDVCLVLLRKAELFTTVLPSKMLEFMACGRPVVLGVDGQARRILDEAHAGLYITPGDPEALVQAVMTLYRDPALRYRLGENGRNCILKQFSREQKALQYLSRLEAVRAPFNVQGSSEKVQRSRLWRQIALRWLPLLGWMGVVLGIGSSGALPMQEGVWPRWLLRKGIHLGEYAVLGLLFYRILAMNCREFHLSHALKAVCMTVAFAGFDEWRQTFIPARSGRLVDVGIDAIGAGLGQVLVWKGAKRVFDLTISGLGLLGSLPLWGLIALAIKWEDGGPVFFHDLRVGQGGELFTALKFRTMVQDADRLFGPRQAAEDDPRVTRVGRLLRATAMDELPQLWNIFRGEMSFVGPRALRPGEIEVRSARFNVPRRLSPLSPLRSLRERDEREKRDEGVDCGEQAEGVTPLEQIPGYWQRHVVQPGLTGIAQIFADRDIPSRQKFRYDLLYLRRRSFWLDLRLVALSFWVTFRGRWEVRGTKF